MIRNYKNVYLSFNKNNKMELCGLAVKEIEEGFKLGFLNGLNYLLPSCKRGITDIDGTIVKLSKMVPN